MTDRPSSAQYTSYEQYNDAVDETEAAAAFKNLVQSNPEVCSNCFLHIRDIYFPHSTALDKRGAHTETYQGLVRYFLPKRNRVERANVPEDQSARNPPLSCGNCGSIRASTRRPLPTHLAIAYAWNLSATLSHFGVEHDPLLLAFVVAHRNRFPALSGRDDDTFREAVEFSAAETATSYQQLLTPNRADPARVDAAQPAPDVDHATPSTPQLPPPADRE